MAATKTRTSSFSRISLAVSSSQTPGLKYGPNGTIFVSSGIPDLDKILGGGFHLGSLVMVMEDAEAPHHMLLLRNFMSQGLIHNQPLLYASPSRDPRGFLGTLPSPVSSKDDKSRDRDPEQEKGLRIAWQYKKYFGEHQQNFDSHGDNKREYCNDFDLRKPLERHFLSRQSIDCVSFQDFPNLAAFRDRCATFLVQCPSVRIRCGTCKSFIGAELRSNLCSIRRLRKMDTCRPSGCSSFQPLDHGHVSRVLAVGSEISTCGTFEWDMLSFLRSLKSMIQSSNAVAVITFPPSLLSPSSSKRWQHMADTLLSVRGIPDEDKELAKLLTGYQDMVGLLNVHKLARINTQVPVILEATTYSIKLQKRRSLVLECLNQGPIDGSSGTSYATSSSCSGSSRTGTLDF